jgi:hypothetical protein
MLILSHFFFKSDSPPLLAKASVVHRQKRLETPALRYQLCINRHSIL